MFAANLGCKKMSNVDGLCACSPIQYPSLALVIKGANQIDLLNPSTNGYFASTDIQLYYQEQGGSLKQLKTYIRPPFGYGNNNEKFTYYQLYSEEILSDALTKNKQYYLKLRDNEPIKLTLEFTPNSYRVAKLLLNEKEAVAEKGEVAKYVPNMFYVELL
jgi:hypothetical protein